MIAYSRSIVSETNSTYRAYRSGIPGFENRETWGTKQSDSPSYRFQQSVSGGIWHKHHQPSWYILHRRAGDLSVLPRQRLLRIVEVKIHGKPQCSGAAYTIHFTLNESLAICRK